MAYRDLVGRQSAPKRVKLRISKFFRTLGHSIVKFFHKLNSSCEVVEAYTMLLITVLLSVCILSIVVQIVTKIFIGDLSNLSYIVGVLLQLSVIELIMFFCLRGVVSR